MSGYVNCAERILWDARNSVQRVLQPYSKEALIEAARKGRIAAQSPHVLARLGEKKRSHRLAEHAWNPADQPDWLDDKSHIQQIHPRLADVTISNIALTLGVSLPYASDIQAGRRRPHPRHWVSLARLVSVSGPG